MPTTRSAAQKKPREASFGSEVQRVDEGSSDSEQGSVSLFTAIEDHLKQAQLELSKFKRQLKVLRKEKSNLNLELEDAKDLSALQVHGRNRTREADGVNSEQLNNSDLQKRVKELTLENQRQKKRIEKFKRKELQEEVKDLLPKKDKNAVDGGMYPEYRMRKLLRKFSDLMLVTTIQDDMTQICPVCLEKLQLNNCSALQCQHLICHECLPMISKGADETIKCPECRKSSERDELEKIHMTEQDRWDRLLEVAQAWDAWDHRGEEETTEEEAEESFIDDGTGASEASSEVGNETKSAQHTSSDAESPLGDGNDNPPTPPPCNSRLFSESPMKEKRKRMEELAEARARKKRR